MVLAMNPKYLFGTLILLAAFVTLVLAADAPESTPLATRAYGVLKDHCAKCHHAAERPEDEPRVSEDTKRSIKTWIEAGSPQGGFGSASGGN
jgi:hypothetical protein